MRKLFLTCALAGASVPLVARADFDVSPALQSGKVVTNAYEDATSSTVNNVRVFGLEFGEDPLDPYFLEDPGFHPLPENGFAAGVAVGAKLFSPLSFWTGSGFGALPAGETLDITRGSTTITLGSTGFSGSLPIATTDALGEFDEHLSSTLHGVSSVLPSTGVYLISLTLTANGLADSDPVYLVYNNGADELDHEAAILYARDHFAPGSTIVPEPASLSGLAIAGLLMARRRRH